MVLVFCLSIFTLSFGQTSSLVIGGVLDLDVPVAGNSGKGIELVAIADIADLSVYAIGVANKTSLEGNTVILATAHPSKFSEVVMNETGIKPELPENLKNILDKKEKYEKLPQDLKKIQNYILERA